LVHHLEGQGQVGAVLDDLHGAHARAFAVMANPIYSKLPTTIFTVMSTLARDHGAINLGQGYPDEPGPEAIRRQAADEATNGDNQYPPSLRRPELRQAGAAHYARRQRPRLDGATA